MNRTNEELRERIVSKLSAKLAAHTPLGDTEILNAASITAHLLPLIQSYTNAEIARTLDRLEAQSFPQSNTNYIFASAIQAERAKLKEVK